MFPLQTEEYEATKETQQNKWTYQLPSFTRCTFKLHEQSEKIRCCGHTAGLWAGQIFAVGKLLSSSLITTFSSQSSCDAQLTAVASYLWLSVFLEFYCCDPMAPFWCQMRSSRESDVQTDSPCAGVWSSAFIPTVTDATFNKPITRPHQNRHNNCMNHKSNLSFVSPTWMF